MLDNSFLIENTFMHAINLTTQMMEYILTFHILR